MKNNTQTEVPAQGAETSKNLVDQAQIRMWLVKDLGTAISCLSAIHSDPDMLNALADFMLGRINNAKNAQANQTDHFKQQN